MSFTLPRESLLPTFLHLVGGLVLAQWTGRAPDTLITTQILIGALATAFGTALSEDVWIHFSFLQHTPFLISQILEIGGLHPLRRVDYRGVLLGTRAWLERAPGITSSGEGYRPFPAQD